MSKLKKYSFYIGIVGAILSVIGFVLDFFGLVNILPMIIDIVAIISAILISLGVIEKDDKTSTNLKEDIKTDIIEKIDYPNTLKKDAEDKDKTE